MLNYNVGQKEVEDLIIQVDSKGLGFFSMKELVIMLSHCKFKLDQQA